MTNGPFSDVPGLSTADAGTAPTARAGRAATRRTDRARSLGGASKTLPGPATVAVTQGAGAADPLAQVEAYWRARIGTRRVPLRRDIDPAGIENLLPATMILERVGPGIARIRVAGQQIERMCGMDTRGIPVSAFFAADARETLGAYVEAAFAGPAIVSVPLLTGRRFLRRGVAGQLLILPLDDGTGSGTGPVSRALAVIVMQGEVTGAAPVRFGIPPEAPIRCEVMPLPDTISRALFEEAPVRAEPSVEATRDRRRAREDLRRRFRLFEVVDGNSAVVRSASDAPPRLSVVASND